MTKSVTKLVIKLVTKSVTKLVTKLVTNFVTIYLSFRIHTLCFSDTHCGFISAVRRHLGLGMWVFVWIDVVGLIPPVQNSAVCPRGVAI